MPNEESFVPGDNWERCLYCGSDQIEGGSVEISHERVDGGLTPVAYQPVSCRECCNEWTETYRALRRTPESVDEPGDTESESASAANRLLAAANGVADLENDCWVDLGQHFSCDEADAVEHLLREAGNDEGADLLRDSHAAKDEPGDLHSNYRDGVLIEPPIVGVWAELGAILSCDAVERQLDVMLNDGDNEAAGWLIDGHDLSMSHVADHDGIHTHSIRMPGEEANVERTFDEKADAISQKLDAIEAREPTFDEKWPCYSETASMPVPTKDWYYEYGKRLTCEEVQALGVALFQSGATVAGNWLIVGHNEANPTHDPGRKPSLDDPLWISATAAGVGSKVYPHPTQDPPLLEANPVEFVDGLRLPHYGHDVVADWNVMHRFEAKWTDDGYTLAVSCADPAFAAHIPETEGETSLWCRTCDRQFSDLEMVPFLDEGHIEYA